MKYTFDLDRAISTWKQSLKMNRSFSGDDLLELEIHLRDHVEMLEGEGLATEEAYRQALRQIGNMPELEPEFQKVKYGSKRRRKSLLQEFSWLLAMFRNYLLTSTRYLFRHHGFAAINLFGLTVGLAGCLLMVLFIRSEMTFGTGIHDNEDRIYRLGQTSTGWPYGKILEAEYPEVEKVTYIRRFPTYSIKIGSDYSFEKITHVDNQFLDIFDYPLIEGDRKTALRDAYSIVLSRPLAERLYGEQPALGQILVMDDTLNFAVTGVIDIPTTSHIQTAAFVSLETVRSGNPEGYDEQMATGWLDLNMQTYLQLAENVDVTAFTDKIRNLPSERAAEYLERWGAQYELDLENVKDIYLRSAYGNRLGAEGNAANVRLLAGIGVFLLIIAAINFINLTTARSSVRSREVGLRKAIGAERSMLTWQFMFDASLTSVVAGVLSVGVAIAALPYFNDLVVKTYPVSDLINLPMIGILILVVGVLSVLAGFYPAFVLSGFDPVKALCGGAGTSPRGGRMRQTLVVFQFAISGALIISTVVAIAQVRFMQEQPLGFEGEQTLVLDARRTLLGDRAVRAEAMQARLAAHSSIDRVGSMWTVPGHDAWRGQLSFPEGYPDGESISLEYYAVGFGFIESLGLEIVAGRDFSRDFGTDAAQAVLINEAAVREAGWASPQDALGKGFPSPGSGKPDAIVIGVVKDYHQHGLQREIDAMMIGIRPANGYYTMRVQPGATTAALVHISEVWSEFYEGYPYETFFLNEEFGLQYEAERRLIDILATFSILTIIIACLGLSGLAAFTAAQRTKEIGIRKALGASSRQVVMLLSGDFMKPVLISFVVASIAGYALSSNWIRDFAYQVEIGVGMLFLSGGIMILIAFATVSIQAVKAAVAAPVDSIRYE